MIINSINSYNIDIINNKQVKLATIVHSPGRLEGSLFNSCYSEK